MDVKAILLLTSLSVTYGQAQATPFIYTFSGEVTQIASYVDGVQDFSYNIDGTQFAISENISYKFLIDTETDGYCSPYNSDQCDFSPDINGKIEDKPFVDYFYTQLFSASKSVSYDWYGAELNYGLRIGPENNINSSQASGGSAITINTSASTLLKDIKHWDSLSLPLDSYQVNGLTGLDSWYYKNNSGLVYEGFVKSTLSLKSITEVPEPPSLILLALGILIFPLIHNQRSNQPT